MSLSKVIIFILLLLSLIFSQSNQYRIAVTPFSNLSGKEDPTLQNQISEQLVTLLAKSGNLQLVERSRIDAALDEMGIVLSGLVDKDNAVKIGQLTGATVCLTGSYYSIGKVLEINTRLINIETGEIEKGKSFRVEGKINKRSKIVRELSIMVEKKLIGKEPRWSRSWVRRHPVLSTTIATGTGYLLYKIFVPEPEPTKNIPEPPKHPNN